MNSPIHAAGTATMNIPLSQYKSFSGNFSKTPSLNIGINSSAGFRLQSSTSSLTPQIF